MEDRELFPLPCPLRGGLLFPCLFPSMKGSQSPMFCSHHGQSINPLPSPFKVGIPIPLYISLHRENSLLPVLFFHC